MNQWGVAWGDSWGWSWGPLHEVEDRPRHVYGSGQGKARFYSPEPEDLSHLHRDDMVAVEFLIALVTKGFLDGKHT